MARGVSWRELLLAYTCQHPNMKWGKGYYISFPEIYVAEWDCPDCGQYGDSTMGGPSGDLDLCWAEYVTDGWLRQGLQQQSSPREDLHAACLPLSD